MAAVLVTLLAIVLLVGVVYLLLREPQLLAAGSAIGIGLIFVTLPLIISMAAFFSALVFGMGAVAITYGIMTINAHRREMRLQQELIQVQRAARRGQRVADLGPARGHAATDDPDDMADLDDESLFANRHRWSRMSRQLARGEDGTPVRGRTGGRRASDAETDVDPEPSATIREFEQGLESLEQKELTRRSANASAAMARRSGADDRARSLARLARRR